MPKNIHVVPGDGEWSVTVEGDGRSSRFSTQHEAMEVGRRLAKANRSEHIVHGRDGRIRQRDSFGRDPFPPRG
jgi:ketosteroid isomerase-like protein